MGKIDLVAVEVKKIGGADHVLGIIGNVLVLVVATGGRENVADQVHQRRADQEDVNLLYTGMYRPQDSSI